MIKLFEDGTAAELLKDGLENPQGSISPEKMAPPIINTEYSDEEDPEIIGEEAIKEGISNIEVGEYLTRLMEAGVTAASKIRSFLQGPSPNKSYSAFQASEFGDPDIFEGKYKAYAKAQIQKGEVNLTPEQLSQINSRAGGGAGGSGKKSVEYYDVPELPAKFKPSANLKNLETKYASSEDPVGSTNADEQFENMYDIVADIASGDATKRHALIYGDPGIGKTYECSKALRENIGRNHKGATQVYYKGNIGRSLTSLVGFFYHHRLGKVIMLDDNDAMLMVGGVPQEIKLFFKAILDPDALSQPIAVPTTVIRGVEKSLEALERQDQANEDAAASKKKKGRREAVKITIDRERLKEGALLIYANGKELLDTRIPLDEALEFYNGSYDPNEEVYERSHYKKSWKKLIESDDDDDDYEDDDEDFDEIAKKVKRRKDEDDENEFIGSDDLDEDGRMPTEFTFNSSVIFISNLSKNQIDPAIWDRFTTARIELNPLEYMDRLGKIYGGLGNVNAEISATPQQYVDWAKKCVYGILLGIIEAWQLGIPLLGVQVQVPKRTLTFRMFTDFVEFFLRSARAYTRRVGGGDLKNQSYRDKVAVQIEKKLVQEMLRKITLAD